MEKYLQKIIEGVSNTHGTDFFNAITLQLTDVIQSDYTFITKINKETLTSQTIALVAKGQLADNFEYSLVDTPCSNVADDSVCIYPDHVTHLFPKDQLLIDMNIEAYLGTPLHDSAGNVMGLIVALYEKEISDSDLTTTLFKIFSGRIAAEMERIEHQDKLVELNNTLEQKVLERTEDLNRTVNRLRTTQDQLIESEKLASLGNLVASVAHEVNTPLGIAITGQSLIQDIFDQFDERVTNKELTLEHMTEFRELNSETLPLIHENLQRAKNLINNFKNTAADQHSDIEETISLTGYYEQILNTLSPMMKRHSVSYELNIQRNIDFKTFPGVHSQIITNLVTNSIKHGFKDKKAGHIKIDIKCSETQITILYSDNGHGLDTEGQSKIFQPFYTTARGSGGTGLGMAIAHNLVKQKLNGHIQLITAPVGFSMEYSFPITL